VFAVRTVRKTQIHCGQSVPHRKRHLSATEPNRLMLCGGEEPLFAVRTVQNTQIHCDQLWNVKAGDTYSDHWASNEYMKCFMVNELMYKIVSNYRI
jgi:hypothetical protein